MRYCKNKLKFNKFCMNKYLIILGSLTGLNLIICNSIIAVKNENGEIALKDVKISTPVKIPDDYYKKRQLYKRACILL